MARLTKRSAAIFLLMTGTAAAAPVYTVQNIVDPDGNGFTEVFGINDAGAVVGTDNAVANQGFTLSPNGKFTPDNVGGAQQTQVTGIAGNNTTVGIFVDQNGTTQGFAQTVTTTGTQTSPYNQPGTAFNQLLGVSANGSQEVIDINFPGQACCGQLPGPNLAGERPGTVNVLNTPTLAENLVFGGYGGDQVGALLISPFVKRGSTSSTPYNHYSTLRTIETIFNLGYLGYAAKIPSIGYNPGGMVDDPNIFYK